MTSHDSPWLWLQGGGMDTAMVEAEGSTGNEYNEDEPWGMQCWTGCEDEDKKEWGLVEK